MKHTILAACILTLNLNAFSQKEFFKSQQVYEQSHLKSFYSSVAIEGNTVYFLANDYTLYAYDKSTGQLKWKSYTSYKTSVPPFVGDDKIYVGHYEDRNESTAVLDIKTGSVLKKLPVGPLQSKPVLKDGVLFGTAIYEGGCLFAYDTRKDTVLWWRFLAHGVSHQPDFFEDEIRANAEANNWVRVNYNGQLLDTTCKEKADIFVRDIPCILNYSALTHDRQEINGKFASAIYGKDEPEVEPKLLTTSTNSFILHNGMLSIIANKRKIKNTVDLNSLSDSITGNEWGLNQLLQANDKQVSLIHQERFIIYDFKTKKLVKLLDLTNWEPYSALINENKLWLISKKDGLLYGLQL